MSIEKMTINSLLMRVFDDILTFEATTLKNGSFNDVSITEVHTIEAIGMYEKPPASEVSKRLRITAGTLSVAINNLVKKGYVERIKSSKDKRVVNLNLTNKGRLLYRVHAKFHSDMVNDAITDISEEEETLLLLTLTKLHKYIKTKYLKEIKE